MGRKQAGFGHLGILLAVIVVVVAGAVGWYVWDKQKDDGAIGASQKEPADKANLERLFSDAKQEISKNFPEEDYCPNLDMVVSLVAQPKGFDYKVELGSPGYVLTVCTTKKADSIIKSQLEKAGLVPAKSPLSSEEVYYESGNSWCSLGENELMPHATLLCEYKPEFVRAAKRGEPFIKALSKSEDKDEAVIAGPVELEQNKNKTYDYAEMMRYNTIHYFFYKKTSDDKWTYLGSTRHRPDCSDARAKEMQSLYENVCS